MESSHFFSSGPCIVLTGPCVDTSSPGVPPGYGRACLPPPDDSHMPRLPWGAPGCAPAPCSLVLPVAHTGEPPRMSEQSRPQSRPQSQPQSSAAGRARDMGLAQNPSVSSGAQTEKGPDRAAPQPGGGHSLASRAAGTHWPPVPARPADGPVPPSFTRDSQRERLASPARTSGSPLDGGLLGRRSDGRNKNQPQLV